MKKFKRFLAISMALIVTMSTNAFASFDVTGYECPECNAKFNSSSEVIQHIDDVHTNSSAGTNIELSNSSENVATDTLDKTTGTDYFADETTNNWQDGSITEEVRVTVNKASEFEITIPKEIVLDGSTGTATYKVKAKGDIAGDQKITVTPDTNFALNESGGKANVTATVTQPNTEYSYTDLQGEGTEYNGNISATLTAGEWSGKFNFNIEFKANGVAEACEHDYQYTSSESINTSEVYKIYTCTKCGKIYHECGFSGPAKN